MEIFWKWKMLNLDTFKGKKCPRILNKSKVILI